MGTVFVSDGNGNYLQIYAERNCKNNVFKMTENVILNGYSLCYICMQEHIKLKVFQTSGILNC